MIGIVIVAHGGLAKEYLAAMEHVLGPQVGVVPITIAPDDHRGLKTDEICQAADSVDTGAGVVVVTDMFGGSPSNLSVPACFRNKRMILAGANLPMLLKLAKIRHKPVTFAVEAAMEAGKKYIRSFDGAALDHHSDTAKDTANPAHHK